MTTAYRADVDGLRAVAVLLVVAFHAFPKQVGGGFVGVDIFFVISGYLITGIIASAAASGTFSFATFYARRARRIFPALGLVLVSTLAAGWWLLLPGSLAELGRHTLAGAFFVENGLLLDEVGYFDNAAELKPLLHLWSLGIEEQFYLVWPVALVFALSRRWSSLRLGAIAFVASFVCNMAIVHVSQPAAFYLPVTRLWELMAGAMLACSPISSLSPRWRDRIATAGALAIAVAVVVLGRGQLFPGAWALLPVGGTAALLYAGEATWIARVVLRHPAIVMLGLISYPLYLWHWPILSLARNAALRGPTDLERFGCVVLAVVLAYATFRLLERPIRPIDVRWRGAVAMAGCLVAIAGAGAQIALARGYAGRFPPAVQAIAADHRPETDRAVRAGECQIGDAGRGPIFPASCDPASPQGRIALWGDSFAGSLYPGLREIAPVGSLGQYTAAGCPPILGFESARRHCGAVAEEVIARLAMLRVETVVLAARWTLYDGRDGWGVLNADALATTVARLRSIGVTKIVVTGQLPVWKAAVPRIASRLALRGEPFDWNAAYIDPRTFALNAWIERFAAAHDLRFVSPPATFCRFGTCRLIVPDSGGIPTAYDEGHLTAAASRWFAKQAASDFAL